jgi:hypothetical protein
VGVNPLRFKSQSWRAKVAVVPEGVKVETLRKVAAFISGSFPWDDFSGGAEKI